jgi:hypothetical protein
MEDTIKKWRDNNKDKVKLQKKREKIRSILRKNNILPNIGIEPDEEQKLILDQLSNNDFSFYENYKMKKKEDTIIKKQNYIYKKRIHKESERPVLKRARITYELREIGILPPLGVEPNEEQKSILDFVNENYETPIKSFLTKYSHLIPPQRRMLYKTKKSGGKRKLPFNLSVEDIIIPTHCPYLGVELLTHPDQSNSPNYFSIDRIDSTKGYVKGNIQIISLLANTMKNNATINQLIDFCKGVIRLHGDELFNSLLDDLENIPPQNKLKIHLTEEQYNTIKQYSNFK